MKPHGLDLIEMPWLCSTHGLSVRPSFSEQHSEPGWMTQSNCIHIRFFFFWQFMVLAIQWSVSPVTVMKTPKSLYHEPFLFPYQLSRPRLSHGNTFSRLSDKPSCAQVYLDSDLSTGFLFLVFVMGKISGSRGPTCSGQKEGAAPARGPETQSYDLLCPKTQLVLLEPALETWPRSLQQSPDQDHHDGNPFTLQCL